MTAKEIRATCANDDDWTSWLKEIALQLALLNERVEFATNVRLMEDGYTRAQVNKWTKEDA